MGFPETYREKVMVGRSLQTMSFSGPNLQIGGLNEREFCKQLKYSFMNPYPYLNYPPI